MKAYPELFTLTVREKKKIFVMTVAYCVLALFAKAARTQRNMAGVLVLVLAVFTVTSFGNIFLQGKYMCGLLSALLVVSIMLNVSYQYSYEKDYLSEFAGNGKSLVWSHDGIPQHLNSLAYYGRYLREVLHTIFVEHKLELPM